MRIGSRGRAGLIVTSSSVERVDQLLEDHTRRFYVDCHASAPPLEKAME